MPKHGGAPRTEAEPLTTTIASKLNADENARLEALAQALGTPKSRLLRLGARAVLAMGTALVAQKAA